MGKVLDRFWGIGLGMGGAKCFREGFNAVERGFMEGWGLYNMVRVSVV